MNIKRAEHTLVPWPGNCCKNREFEFTDCILHSIQNRHDISRDNSAVVEIFANISVIHPFHVVKTSYEINRKQLGRCLINNTIKYFLDICTSYRSHPQQRLNYNAQICKSALYEM